MKQIQLLLAALLLFLQVGCETTRNFTYERQQRYHNVLIVSSIGDKLTANKTKNYLLAIQNNVYREPLGEQAFVEEIEDFVQSKLSGRVPFNLVTMHDFYPENKDEANDIFNNLMRYKKTSDLLLRNNFDALILVRGNRILYGHPYDGIDKIYEEVGLYKEGNKDWFFTHFTFSFINAENDHEFSEYKLNKIPYTTTKLNWKSSKGPWKDSELPLLVEEAIVLTEDSLNLIIEDMFFSPNE